MTKRPVYLAAGGTGGHIFPALAVAEALQTLGYSAHIHNRRGAKLLGDAASMPATYVIAATSPFQNGIIKRTFAVAKLAVGAVASLYHLLMRRPARSLALAVIHPLPRWWLLVFLAFPFCCMNKTPFGPGKSYWLNSPMHWHKLA